MTIHSVARVGTIIVDAIAAVYALAGIAGSTAVSELSGGASLVAATAFYELLTGAGVKIAYDTASLIKDISDYKKNGTIISEIGISFNDDPSAYEIIKEIW